MPSLVSGVLETEDQSWRSLHDVLSVLLGQMEFTASAGAGGKLE